jgi:hypothetical protein
MTPDCKVPPFNLDALPLWLHPDIFDETKDVANRGGWFVLLYTLSMLLNSFFIFGPMALYMAFGGGNGMVVALAIWVSASVPAGILIGLAVWWDYRRAARKKDGE